MLLNAPIISPTALHFLRISQWWEGGGWTLTSTLNMAVFAGPSSLKTMVVFNTDMFCNHLLASVSPRGKRCARCIDGLPFVIFPPHIILWGIIRSTGYDGLSPVVSSLRQDPYCELSHSNIPGKKSNTSAVVST
jgi:hypothetical protein